MKLLAALIGSEDIPVEQRRRLKMDLDELCFALDDSSYEHAYYLDLETGELLAILDSMHTGDADELREQIDADPDRYEPLPRADSYERYGDMQDFIATVDDERVSELLEVAIDGKGAFRRFKDVLASFLHEREKWLRFKDNRLKQRAVEWLEDICVEPL